METNISEKAQALKSKVENELQQKKEEETRARTEELRSQIDTEKTVKEDFNQKNSAVSQKKGEIEELLRAGKGERATLQKEGKSVNQELRSSEAGNLVLKEKEHRDEIFGETITKLKEINEATKSYRTELKELLAEFKNESGTYTAEKQKRLNEFRDGHPEIGNLQSEAAEYEKWQRHFAEREQKIEAFLSDPITQECMDHEIVREEGGYRGVTDKTLKDHIKHLEDLRNVLYNGFQKEKANLKEVRKGFFQSQKSFLKEQDADLKEIEERYKGNNKDIEFGENGLNESFSKRTKLEEQLTQLFAAIRSYEKDQIVTEAKTVGGLIEYCKKDLEEEKKKYTLTEEEQLLLELNQELHRG